MRRSHLILLFSCLLTGCYNQGPITPDAWDLTVQQLDSISFYTTHHYTQGYNFVVNKDSLKILEQQSEMMPVPDILTSEMTAGDETMPMLSLVDSIILHRHEHVVVADIRTVPTDSIQPVYRFLLRCPPFGILGFLCYRRRSLWREKTFAQGGEDCSLQRYPIVLPDATLSAYSFFGGAL